MECKTESYCSTDISGNKYCNLCYDRECKDCTVFGDTCEASSCLVQGDSSESGGQCTCDYAWVRPATDDGAHNDGFYCLPCWTNCGICETGDLENYTDCVTECKPGAFETGLGELSHYIFC